MVFIEPCVLLSSSILLQLVLLLSQLDTIYLFPTPANQRANDNNIQVNALQAVDFMKKFGYLEKSVTGLQNVDSLYSSDAIEIALKEVQLYGGIPQTGILDNKTIKLMNSARCGVPEKGKLLTRSRTKRFVLSPGKWRKYNLTYYIANWSPQIGEENVRVNMKRAFDSWSSYSQLNFTEVFHNNADITIAFAIKDHGDGFPFDGRGYILGHAFMPEESGGLGGDVHFDEDEEWKVDPGPFETGTDFFSVAVHEVGHSLGLMHSPERGSVMNAYYKQLNAETFQLGYDDILAVYDKYIAGRSRDTSGDAEIYRYDFDNSNENTPSRSTTVRTRPYTVRPFTTTTPKKPTITYIGDDESVDTHKKHDVLHGIPNTEEPPIFIANDHDIDDVCFGNFDAVAYFRSELFIFKNGQVWRLRSPGSILKGYPVTSDRFFRTPGGPSSKITAVYERPSDSNIIIFSGKNYWIYDGNQFIDGSPQPISNYGLPNYIDQIDAAMVWSRNQKTYLFSGDRYWRYDEFKRAMDENYPRSIEQFKNIPAPLDAAMTWNDGITYFFKDKQYWAFNNTWKKAEEGYPKSATAYWLGCKS